MLNFFFSIKINKTFKTIFQKYSLKKLIPKITSIKKHLFQIHTLILLIQNTNPSQILNQ